MEASNDAFKKNSYKLLSWIQSWKQLLFYIRELHIATKNWAENLLCIIKESKIAPVILDKEEVIICVLPPCLIVIPK